MSKLVLNIRPPHGITLSSSSYFEEIWIFAPIKANFPQEATFFILCHLFFLHGPLFKSCYHTTFEYLSLSWGWASLLERAATLLLVLSNWLNSNSNLGRKHYLHSSHIRKIDDIQILNICFRTHLALSKALIKLKNWCFALHQLYIELKTKSLFTTTSIVLPFKFKW